MALQSIEIVSVEQLEKWLKGKPVVWAQAIASRAALRVLPFVGEFKRYSGADQTYMPEVYLATFRAAHASWAAIMYPRQNLIAAARRAARAADRVVGQVASSTGAVNVAKACYAAVDAASSIGRDDIQFAIRAVQNSIGASTAALSQTAPDMWDEIALDAVDLLRYSTLDPDGTAQDLVGKRIWRQGQPLWSHKSLARFSDAASNTMVDWSGWLGWYGARLRGVADTSLSVAAAEEINLRIANQDDDWWASGHENVNTILSAWIEEAKRDRPRLTISEFILRYIQSETRPVTIDNIRSAFAEANFRVVQKTMRGELSRLASMGRIFRVDRGVYAASEKIREDYIASADAFSLEVVEIQSYADTLLIGSPVVASGTFFTLGENWNSSDVEIAQSLLESGRLEVVKSKVDRLRDRAGQRLKNYQVWDDLLDALPGLSEWLTLSPVLMAKRVGVAWELSVTVGRFLDLDKKLSVRPGAL